MLPLLLAGCSVGGYSPSFHGQNRSVFVTFLNTKTDNRFTFKVVKHKKDDIYFVNVLTGSDVYTFVGSIRNGVYKHSPKSNISNEAQSVKVFNYILNKLYQILIRLDVTIMNFEYEVF